MSATVTSRRYFVNRAVLYPLQNFAERLDQVEERDGQTGVFVFAANALICGLDQTFSSIMRFCCSISAAFLKRSCSSSRSTSSWRGSSSEVASVPAPGRAAAASAT